MEFLEARIFRLLPVRDRGQRFRQRLLPQGAQRRLVGDLEVTQLLAEALDRVLRHPALDLRLGLVAGGPVVGGKAAQPVGLGLALGLASDWAIAEATTPSDLGEFSGLGVETFELDWGLVAFSFAEANLEAAVFDLSLGLETFDASWGPFDSSQSQYTEKVETVAPPYLPYHSTDSVFEAIQVSESAPFNTVVISFETFETEWDNDEFKLAFVGVGTDLTLAAFNITTPDLFEDFEAEWGNDEIKLDIVGVGTDLTLATFAPSGTEEPFSPFLNMHARLTVNTAVSGATYTVTVDGFSGFHVATGGDTINTIVDALVLAVTNASLSIVAIDEATSVGIRVERPGVAPTISIACTTPTAVQDDTQVAEGGAWTRPLFGV